MSQCEKLHNIHVQSSYASIGGALRHTLIVMYVFVSVFVCVFVYVYSSVLPVSR